MLPIGESFSFYSLFRTFLQCAGGTLSSFQVSTLVENELLNESLKYEKRIYFFSLWTFLQFYGLDIDSLVVYYFVSFVLSLHICVMCLCTLHALSISSENCKHTQIIHNIVKITRSYLYSPFCFLLPYNLCAGHKWLTVKRKQTIKNDSISHSFNIRKMANDLVILFAWVSSPDAYASIFRIWNLNCVCAKIRIFFVLLSVGSGQCVKWKKNVKE